MRERVAKCCFHLYFLELVMQAGQDRTQRQGTPRKTYSYRSIGTPPSSSIETPFPCRYNCTVGSRQLHRQTAPAVHSRQTGKSRLNRWRRGHPAHMRNRKGAWDPAHTLTGGHWIIYEGQGLRKESNVKETSRPNHKTKKLLGKKVTGRIEEESLTNKVCRYIWQQKCFEVGINKIFTITVFNGDIGEITSKARSVYKWMIFTRRKSDI